VSQPPPDRTRARFWSELSAGSRWRLRVAAAAVAIICLLLLLRGFYRRELYHLTGGAEWIWVTGEVQEKRPTAALFYVPLDLHDHPERAVAKVCGDRQYVLWINGQPAAAGTNRPHFQLDVVPVTDMLSAGRNVIAVEVRSPTSVGALLFSLDLEPTVEGRRAGDPKGRNVLVSGSRWRVVGSWGRGAPSVIPEGARPPWVWGRPPDHPWSYPMPVLHDRPLVQAVVSEPRRIAADSFTSVSPGVWRVDLGQGFAGLVWLESARGARTWNQVREVWGVAPNGFDSRHVALVAMPGERRWLFPGRFEGRWLEVEGDDPPDAIEIVEAMDTRVR
jgi:hypothetical protein